MVSKLNIDRDEHLEGSREGDLEKAFRPAFEQYEEWRASQGIQEPEVEPKGKKTNEETQKKKGCGTLDIVFLIVGFLVAMLWRGCQAS